MLRVKSALKPEQRDAYYQLVEHPIVALANLYELYYAVAWNRRLAGASDSRANVFADRAEAAFRRDQKIAEDYHLLNHGKWNGMMLQTHIGYVGWQQPDRDVMPKVKRLAPQASPKEVVFAAASAETSNAIVIEAPHYSKAVDGKGLAWRVIPNLGNLGAVSAFPQGAAPTSQQDGMHLEYDLALDKGGDLNVDLYMVPTLDVSGEAALRIGISVDERPMQTLTERLLPATGGISSQAAQDWTKAVEDNASVRQAHFANIEPGKHVIKIWRIDDNVVLEKIV